MNKQGQGALEYLLLIGGAVLVASIVIALITGTTSGQKDPRAQTKCAIKTDCVKCVEGTDSTWATNACVIVMDDDDTWGEFSGSPITRNADEDDCDDVAHTFPPAGKTFKYCTTQRTI